MALSQRLLGDWEQCSQIFIKICIKEEFKMNIKKEITWNNVFFYVYKVHQRFANANRLLENYKLPEQRKSLLKRG